MLRPAPVARVQAAFLALAQKYPVEESVLRSAEEEAWKAGKPGLAPVLRLGQAAYDGAVKEYDAGVAAAVQDELVKNRAASVKACIGKAESMTRL